MSVEEIKDLENGRMYNVVASINDRVIHSGFTPLYVQRFKNEVVVIALPDYPNFAEFDPRNHFQKSKGFFINDSGSDVYKLEILSYH
jgi:hypothetical protein